MSKGKQVSWSWYPRPITTPSGDKTRPVFITGAPRCGSSWVGEVLGNCHTTRYVYEPFNFHWMPALRGKIRHFRYYGGQSEVSPLLQHVAYGSFHGKQSWKQIARAAYRGYLGAASRTATRVLIKDTTASLISGWIAEQFHAQVLIVMRHPCGFASSLESLDWPLNVNALLNQKELMRDHLEPYRGILRRARNDKWLTRGALWGAIHMVFARQLESHADWRLIRYEALCGDPIGQFETLAQEFGLELGHSTRKRITAICTTDNPDPGSTQRNTSSMPDIWRQRMSPGEIDAVMGIVGEFGLDYYV